MKINERYRNIRFWVILIFVVFISFEVLSRAGLRFIEVTYLRPINISERHKEILRRWLKGELTYLAHDPVLGWTVKPKGTRFKYRSNSKGIRSDKEFEFLPPKNIIRIAAFGDSFTHGDDVENAETWEELLNNQNSRYEALNFGVGGYGLDQAYLRYLKEGVLFNPHIVLIGYMSENINRVVNNFRPFYFGQTGIPFSKPRYVLQNNRLKLLPNPLRSRKDYSDLLEDPQSALERLGINDYYYQSRGEPAILDHLSMVRVFKNELNKVPSENDLKEMFYQTDSEAHKLIKLLFDGFYKKVEEKGSLPIIVLYPGRYDVNKYRKEGIIIYASLLKYFTSKGYRIIDLMEAFQKYENQFNIKELIPYHYSPLANEIVAEHIYSYLRLLEEKDLLEDR